MLRANLFNGNLSSENTLQRFSGTFSNLNENDLNEPKALINDSVSYRTKEVHFNQKTPDNKKRKNFFHLPLKKENKK